MIYNIESIDCSIVCLADKKTKATIEYGIIKNLELGNIIDKNRYEFKGNIKFKVESNGLKLLEEINPTLVYKLVLKESLMKFMNNNILASIEIERVWIEKYNDYFIVETIAGAYATLKIKEE